MLFRAGVYEVDGTGEPVFRHVAGRGPDERQELVKDIASRIGHALERHGLISHSHSLMATGSRIHI